MSLDAFVITDPTLVAPLGTSYTANFVFCSPDGSSGQLVARALVAADIPNLAASKITSGTLATARLGSGTASSTTYLRGDQSWQTISASETLHQVLVAGNNATGNGMSMNGGGGSGGGIIYLDSGAIFFDNSSDMEADGSGNVTLNAISFRFGSSLTTSNKTLDDGSGNVTISNVLTISHHLVLSSITAPSPIQGGLYQDGTNLFFCKDGSTWTTVV